MQHFCDKATNPGSPKNGHWLVQGRHGKRVLGDRGEARDEEDELKHKDGYPSADPRAFFGYFFERKKVTFTGKRNERQSALARRKKS